MKQKKCTASFVFFIFLFVNYLSAQTGTLKVRGIVTDNFTGTPLIGAAVQMKDNQNQTIQGTVTDKNGEFLFEKVAAGRWNFEVNFLGYKSGVLSNIMVNSGQDNYLKIALEEQVTQLEEIIIKPQFDKTTTSNELAAVSARAFTKEETERFAGSLGDPARMVANYAGVQSANDQRNDIVNGGNTADGIASER